MSVKMLVKAMVLLAYVLGTVAAAETTPLPSSISASVTATATATVTATATATPTAAPLPDAEQQERFSSLALFLVLSLLILSFWTSYYLKVKRITAVHE